MLVKILALSILTYVKTSLVTNNTDSDVIVTYSGHAEAIPMSIPDTDTNRMIPSIKTTTIFNDKDDNIYFVPNDKSVVKNNENHDDRFDDGNFMMKVDTSIKTESPPQDIIFVTGKNNENLDKEKQSTSFNQNSERRPSKKETARREISLDCSNLDCNNTLNSICGAKLENRHWRYRIFLNECYFRKVNCLFKFEINRYIVKPKEFCKTVGSHLKFERPFIYNPPMPLLPRETTKAVTSVRRSFSSRRSLNIGMDGTFCSHPCPSSCPENYNPECAFTSTGQRQVFINHCKLDYNSCFYGTVWHKRPLTDCVGSEKADLKQNRAFIGWMQRVGIVDGRGKLMMA